MPFVVEGGTKAPLKAGQRRTVGGDGRTNHNDNGLFLGILAGWDGLPGEACRSRRSRSMAKPESCRAADIGTSTAKSLRGLTSTAAWQKKTAEECRIVHEIAGERNAHER